MGYHSVCPMFLIVLGGSLVLGAGLLAAASLGEGTLVTNGTAAQIIGWLFVLATAVGVASLRRGDFGQLGAAAVTFLSGLTVLYVAYFDWGEVPTAPIRHAAAETLPALPVVYKAVETGTMAAVVPVATKEIPLPVKKTAARIAAPQAARDRCDATSGLAWIVCQERARLEYCEARQDDEAACPSAIPYSPPG